VGRDAAASNQVFEDEVNAKAKDPDDNQQAHGAEKLIELCYGTQIGSWHPTFGASLLVIISGYSCC
jgi:hypothetical protein